MTFVERYQVAETWVDKVLIISIYHTAMTRGSSEWTIRKTASVFEVSVGLVSENIRLANAIDSGLPITECNTRQEALTKIERRVTWRASC